MISMTQAQRDARIHKALTIKAPTDGKVFIEDFTSTSEVSSERLAVLVSSLKKYGRNLVTVIVQRDGEGFKAIANGDWVEAAKVAGLDYVYVVVIDGVDPDELALDMEALQAQDKPKVEAVTVEQPEEIKVYQLKSKNLADLRSLCDRYGISHEGLSRLQIIKKLSE